MPHPVKQDLEKTCSDKEVGNIENSSITENGNVVMSVVKDMAEDANVETVVKESIENVNKENVVKDIAEDANIESVVKESVENVVKESMEDVVKESMEDAVKESFENIVKVEEPIES